MTTVVRLAINRQSVEERGKDGLCGTEVLTETVAMADGTRLTGRAAQEEIHLVALPEGVPQTTMVNKAEDRLEVADRLTGVEEKEEEESRSGTLGPGLVIPSSAAT